MSTLHVDSGDARAHVSLRWLIRVRWGAAILQVATLLIARETLGLVLPLAPLLAIVGVSAATNLAAGRVMRRRQITTSGVAGSLLAIDTLLLTVSLALTGGPLNPFSVVYLVYITLAAVVLGARWTWFLTVLAACGYGSLFLHAMQALPADGHGDHAAASAIGLSSHLQGMWWAFVLAASLTAYFVVKLSSAIERRDQELAQMREQAMRSERLASLTTLAAGAAHELSTPLATIAVVTGEMERALEQMREQDLHAPPDDARARDAGPRDALSSDALSSDALSSDARFDERSFDGLLRGSLDAPARDERASIDRTRPAADLSGALLTDARLIRAELQRCRAILDRMAAQAGETTGEMPLPVAVGTLVADALRALPPDDAARIRVEAPERVGTLTVPGRGVVTALVSLLRNAIDASPIVDSLQPQPITLAAAAEGGIVRLTVRDRGAGMGPDILARAGEPFFSTKPAGAGMGLGLYLTRALAERLGGALRLESTPGAGTAATLELPAAAAADRLPADTRDGRETTHIGAQNAGKARPAALSDSLSDDEASRDATSPDDHVRSASAAASPRPGGAGR